MKWVGPVKAQRGQAVPSVAEADRVVEMRQDNRIYAGSMVRILTKGTGIGISEPQVVE